MLIYLDSSILTRAYLPDEPGHQEAAELVYGYEHLLVSATWTVVEVTSALTRAAKGRRADGPGDLLAVLAEDTGDDGTVTLVRADAVQVEDRVTAVVREHAIRSLDALHLAVAGLAARPLTEPLGFAARDDAQGTVASALGFVPWPFPGPAQG
ncbi:MAG: type II toxin-antitoxin system VapC family toxin [Nocardioidaceae bacterium]